MSEERTKFEIEETIRNEEHARQEEYSRTSENNQKYNN
tara:strand:+ start:421 stop:534 length:114 start_codon:yes stop_codon:yes gene_type:complete